MAAKKNSHVTPNRNQIFEKSYNGYGQSYNRKL